MRVRWGGRRRRFRRETAVVVVSRERSAVRGRFCFGALALARTFENPSLLGPRLSFLERTSLAPPANHRSRFPALLHFLKYLSPTSYKCRRETRVVKLTYDSSLQVVSTWDWCGLSRCLHDTWKILWRRGKTLGRFIIP